MQHHFAQGTQILDIVEHGPQIILLAEDNVVGKTDAVKHTSEDFSDPEQKKPMRRTGPTMTKWEFDVGGSGFDATFGLSFAAV
jgi:hypothetical protein